MSVRKISGVFVLFILFFQINCFAYDSIDFVVRQSAVVGAGTLIEVFQVNHDSTPKSVLGPVHGHYLVQSVVIQNDRGEPVLVGLDQEGAVNLLDKTGYIRTGLLAQQLHSVVAVAPTLSKGEVLLVSKSGIIGEYGLNSIEGLSKTAAQPFQIEDMSPSEEITGIQQLSTHKFAIQTQTRFVIVEQAEANAKITLQFPHQPKGRNSAFIANDHVAYFWNSVDNVVSRLELQEGKAVQWHTRFAHDVEFLEMRGDSVVAIDGDRLVEFRPDFQTTVLHNSLQDLSRLESSALTQALGLSGSPAFDTKLASRAGFRSSLPGNVPCPARTRSPSSR